MSENLKNFLVDLALHADRMQRYSADPQGELDRAGLTADEKAAVMSRDSVRLRTALGRPDNDCMSQCGAKNDPERCEEDMGSRKRTKKRAAKRPAKKTKKAKKAKSSRRR